MWNRIVRMMQNAFKFNEPQILPGRWKLKYTETELDRFLDRFQTQVTLMIIKNNITV